MINNYPITASTKQNQAIRYTRENADGTLSVISADYDYMGRRVYQKVETITPAVDATDGEKTEAPTETRTVHTNHRFLYRGYLQIATLDLTRAALNDLWLVIRESPRRLVRGLDKPKGFAPQGRAADGAAASQSSRGLGGGLDKPKGFAPQGQGRNGVRPSPPQQRVRRHGTRHSLLQLPLLQSDGRQMDWEGCKYICRGGASFFL